MNSDDEVRDLIDWLIERVAKTAGLAPAAIDPERSLHEYGLSSRDMVGLIGELGAHAGRTLPPTFGYQHPTVAALAAAVADARPAAVLGRGSAPAPGEPIAVVGIGCRLPGGIDSPAAFWDLLIRGEDAIGTRPDGRWRGPDHVLDDLPAAGGYLDDVAGFDAAFFGITPREAAVMDPQQRIVLEVAWAALEHAGIAPGTLRGTRTGVYMGVSATEYGMFTMGDVAGIDAWSGTGAAASVIANRLSYLLDLRGPSMVVDTACSSSLVAVHHAVQGLRRGEADAAIVGGVNLMLTPGVTANFDSAGVLAPDGRCKAFDAAADGIVRGEGCGVVVLRRLSDARANGDRVLALINGSATNSDGRSNGMMAPNPDAQEALLAEVYPAAEIDPATVDYVEAHGTGTLLGDPIEAGALGAVLGTGRGAGRPLLIGSVKTNLGHLEGAAGIVGLIKVVLSLTHGRIPASLHFDKPNPHIDFDAMNLRVTAEGTPWPRYSGLAYAGVSAFGFGGSNAHVVLEEWPTAPAPRAVDTDRPEVFALSAASAESLRTRAADLADWLESPAGLRAPLPDVAGVLVNRRDHLAVRAAVVGAGRAAAVEGLRALAAGTPSSTVVSGGPVRGRGPVFVFSGFGSYWQGMGRELLDEPAFRAAVDELEPLFVAEAGFSLREVLACAEPVGFAVAAPALYGTQIALAALWRAHGVRPSAVLGHSVGEVAAAVVAGALDQAQGLRVVLVRTALLAGIESGGEGAMAVLELSEAEFADLAERFPGVEIAVHASPEQCTVTGPAAAVADLVAHVEGLGRLARKLAVGGAGHAPTVDPYLDGFRADLVGLAPAEPVTPCFSSVLDDPTDRPAFDADYWAANLRRPVRFTQAVAAALAAGHTTFLEISPHPIALTGVEQTAAARGATALAIPTLRRDTGVAEWLRAVAALHVGGDSAAIAARYPSAPVLDLPGPVWRHERHWAPDPAPAAGAGHPLLGAHVELPDDGTHVWQADLSADPLPWLADHRAYGVVVLPGTAFLELALSAGRSALGTTAVEVVDLELAEFLALGQATTLSTTLDSAGRVTVRSRSADGAWTTHATATVRAAAADPLGELPAAGAGEPLDLYAAFAASGQDYGPAFRGLSAVVAEPGWASAQVRLPAEAGGHRRFALHPALADACLHALAAAVFGLPGTHGRYVPTAIGRARVVGDPARGVRCVATMGVADSRTLLGTVWLLDVDGQVLVELSDVRAAALGQTPGAWPELAVERRWDAAPLPVAAAAEPRSWVLVEGDVLDEPALPDLADELVATGDDVRAADLDTLVESLRDKPSGVVLVAGPPARYRDPARAEALVHTVARVVAVLAESGATPPRLWLATTGATAVDGEPGEPGLACLRGLVRVLAFEHPELRATLVDLDAESGAPAAAAEVRADRDDDEVLWRHGRRLRARLAAASVEAADPDQPLVRDGAYVITGGLGELGRLVAAWLAEAGATRIVLAGRTHRPEVDDLVRSANAQVEVVLGDLAEPGFADRLVSHAQRDGVPLRGVVHAAGVLDDQPAALLTEAAIARVWRPKALGGLRLHEATAAIPLDWWVAFSSIAGLVGSPGQAAYATANAWLDALVDSRRAAGLPAVTVNWGAWAGESGESRANAVLAELEPEQGMAALAGLLAHDRSGVGVARLDIPRTLALFPDLGRRPFLAGLAGGAAADEPTGWAGLAALRSLPDPRTAVLDHLVTGLAALIGAAPESVDRSAPLTGLGLDSLMAMRLRAGVQRDFETTLPVSLLLRGASLREVADHIADELGLPAALAPVSVPTDTDPLVADPAAAEPAPVIGPRDPTERWLALVWTDALGSEPAGVHRSFYDLGGDDAAVRRVHDAVSTRLADAAPPVATLFARPTIAAMADLLRAEVEGATDGVLNTLRATGNGVPLLLFHPAGGPTSVYHPLVSELPEGFPVYGFERLDDESTVEGKAHRYLEMLREIQPVGPYRLGGWSFGGCLAYEVAHLLTELGERVEQVVLIDTILPLRGDEPESDRLLLDRFDRFAEHVEQTYGVTLDLSALPTLPEDDQIGYVIDRLAALPQMGEAVLRHQYTSYVDARVAERYRPRPYSGRVVLLRAMDPHPLTTTLDPRYLRTDDTLGWDELCSDLHVVRVPGDHLTMIDPPRVSTLARHLARTLASPVRV